MKRIALSLMTIAAVVVVAVGATQAYFSHGKVVGGNTFATGEVTLGSVSDMPVSVTGMIPGVPIMKTVGFEYLGSTAANVYIGNRGNPAYGEEPQIAEVMTVKIVDHQTKAPIFEGNAKELATGWVEIAPNMSKGWKWLDVTFTLDNEAGNAWKNKANYGTQFLIYALQKDAPQPTSIPYCVVGSESEGWKINQAGCP